MERKARKGSARFGRRGELRSGQEWHIVERCASAGLRFVWYRRARKGVVGQRRFDNVGYGWAKLGEVRIGRLR